MTKATEGKYDVKKDSNTGVSYVVIDGVRIRLSTPLILDFDWIGNQVPLNQLRACWHSSGGKDVPMNPRLVGKPGVGKTVLGYSAGKMLGTPVYLFQATSDTSPNDVLINPVVIDNPDGTKQVEYFASTLVTAMIVGGAVVFDEGNRMQEKAWAALSSLLDSRRYIESAVIGVTIKAHSKFRFVATMNDDASCFDLPEYIQSRLQPTIILDFPEKQEERMILESNLPDANQAVLDYVAGFLEAAHKGDERYTVREGIHIANYAGKLVDYAQELGGSMDPGEAVVKAIEQILGVRQTRYIKQILWKEEAA